MYLGIDIGTSGVKVLLVDGDGAPVATHSSPLEISRPHIGWSEQDPNWWWQACDEAMMALRETHPRAVSAVAAIGLSGQMHGLVALDENDTVLRDALLWNDTRCAAQAQTLDTDFPEFRAIGGNAVMPGFTAPKAVWMARYEPELFARIATILLPKDYIRFRLTGDKVSEMSDASGTLWLDVANRCWSEPLLAACGLKTSQMPRLIEGCEPSGRLHDALAQRWGIDASPIIAGGGGDNAAAAIGLGMTNPGDGFVSLGTSGVVFTVTPEFSPAAASGAHAFCHAIPETWHQMGVLLAASDCISWLCQITGQTVDRLMQKMQMTDLSATMPIFHPYLSGERTPHNDANARGGFFGLTRAHETGDMARAVLQGVAYAIADALDVLRAAGGAPSLLMATGGGANNRQWLVYIASAARCRIGICVAAETGAALGAARLAMIADGYDVAAVCTKPAIQEVIEPDGALAEKLAVARAKSQRLYQLMQ